MTKDISLIGSSNVRIKFENNQLYFAADADGVMKREVIFGEYKEKNENNYDSSFSTERFEKISKISSLNDILHVYLHVRIYHYGSKQTLEI